MRTTTRVAVARPRRCGPGRRAGVYFRAFSQMLASTRSSSPASASTSSSGSTSTSIRSPPGSGAMLVRTASARPTSRRTTRTEPVLIRLMSSRLVTSAVSRSVDSSMVASSSASSSGDQVTSVLRRLSTDTFTAASGLRRSWETAASRAVRVRSSLGQPQALDLGHGGAAALLHHLGVGGVRVEQAALRRRQGRRRRGPACCPSSMAAAMSAASTEAGGRPQLATTTSSRRRRGGRPQRRRRRRARQAEDSSPGRSSLEVQQAVREHGQRVGLGAGARVPRPSGGPRCRRPRRRRCPTATKIAMVTTFSGSAMVSV